MQRQYVQVQPSALAEPSKASLERTVADTASKRQQSLTNQAAVLFQFRTNSPGRLLHVRLFHLFVA